MANIVLVDKKSLPISGVLKLNASLDEVRLVSTSRLPSIGFRNVLCSAEAPITARLWDEFELHIILKSSITKHHQSS